MLQPPAEPANAPQPLGIDALSNLPVHYDPPECPRCVYPEGVCYDCQGSLTDPAWPFSYGVESATVTHLHVHAVTGFMRGGMQETRTVARRKLCIPCFRIDWAKVHPEVPCDL